MFKEDGYFIINSLEEEKIIMDILYNNDYKHVGGISSSSYDNGNRPFLNIYAKIKEYHFLYTTFTGIKLKLEDYLPKKSIESKIREIFDNSDNVIACNTIEEKYKLFKLLDRLGYKTSTGEEYQKSSNKYFSLIDYFIRPSTGLQNRISSLGILGQKTKLIYFSDLIKLIKE